MARNEYRNKAFKDEFFPSKIKIGYYEDYEIQEKAMVYSDVIEDVLNNIETDVDDILKELDGIRGIDIIDTVRDKLETLANKIY